MNTHMKTGGPKSPQSPNPLPFNKLMQATATGPCGKVFRASLKERQKERPFGNKSAYKIRESQSNIESITSTVTAIIEHVSNGECSSPPVLLGGCTSADKDIWLAALPSNLADELGFNLIPAIAALSVEGVPEPAIESFAQSINSSVQQLLDDCDAVQAAISNSIAEEYARMKRGQSSMLGICNDALQIADRAAIFCDVHDV